jgi:hypothetical protein
MFGRSVCCVYLGVNDFVYRRFDVEQIGAARPAFFSGRLFGRHVPGACDWSRAHTLTNMPGEDRFKFGLDPHPIESEGRKRRLEPTPEFKAKQVKAERELLRNAVGDERELFREVLDKIEAKELIEKINDKVDQDYIHDFRNWIVGIGKRSDYVKAGVPLTSVGQAKPLSRHKSVIDFVDKLTGRVVDYYAEIVNMKMRGPGVGRHGGPATLNDLWLYFKYVVRNDPIDPKDFIEADKLREEPDNAIRGNGQEGLPDVEWRQADGSFKRGPQPGGIVDENNEAPSMRDMVDDFDSKPDEYRKANFTEARLRQQPADSQTRKTKTPSAELKAVAAPAAKGPEIPLAGGAPVPPPTPPPRAPSPKRAATPPPAPAPATPPPEPSPPKVTEPAPTVSTLPVIDNDADATKALASVPSDIATDAELKSMTDHFGATEVYSQLKKYYEAGDRDGWDTYKRHTLAAAGAF